MDLFEKYLRNLPLTRDDRKGLLVDYRRCSTGQLLLFRRELSDRWSEAQRTLSTSMPAQTQGIDPQEYRIRSAEVRIALIDYVLGSRGYRAEAIPKGQHRAVIPIPIEKRQPSEPSVRQSIGHGISSPDRETLKRNVIIDHFPTQSTSKLCKLFDRYHLRIPQKWNDDFRVGTWAAACHVPELRRRINGIISKHRNRTGECEDNLAS